MKKVILLVLTTLLFSCNEEPINQQTFSFEAAAGIWIPYESIYADGSVFNGAFTVGIFGAYSESFKLNADKTFIALNAEFNNFSKLETGVCSYKSETKELQFDGVFKLKFKVLRIQEK